MFDHSEDGVLSNCQRRISVKRMTKVKPNAIHIRQPSLSHSVSSAASSPTSSTHSDFSSASSSALHRHHEVVEFDPLLMHPTHVHPPARLAERPFIALTGEAGPEPEPRISPEEEDEWRFLLAEQHRLEERKKMALPPLDTPTPLARQAGHDRDAGDDSQQQPPSDYFLVQKRPPLPRSHWSASTIQTMLDITPTPQQEFDSNPDSSREVRPLTQYPNFSYKRSTVPPKRPPLRTVDSVENFMKRGGWKRRGIIFQQDAGYRGTNMTSFSADDAVF